MPGTPLLESRVAGYPCRRGKVRDVYDLGERLVIVATDRISAFDWLLPTGIPDKGRVLTKLSVFWLAHLQVDHHVLSTEIVDLPRQFQDHTEELQGRTMLVRKTKVIPVECVVRGYLAGSAWNDYQRTGSVCGIKLPSGMRQAQRLPEPIFSPATKAQSSHDQNISFPVMIGLIGEELANDLRGRSLALYQRAAEFAQSRGIIVADTKFEWGQLPNGELLLIDEVVTPDSSRFWPVDQYEVGTSPVSFDKQFVRDWLETTGWDKESPPPDLPEEIVAKTHEKYLDAYFRLTGKKL